MIICTECEKERLEIIPMYVHRVCAICALKIRNKIHGLPEDAQFTGKQTKRIYDEEIEYEKKNK